MLLQERYQAVRLLGQGGVSRTFLAIDHAQSPSTSCVIKQLRTDYFSLPDLQPIISLFQQDIQQLKQLSDRSQIPTLLNSFEQDSYFYLIQTYIEGENLATVLAEQDRFTATDIWYILESLLPVLNLIHSHNIIHHDIKPENVILNHQTTPNHSRQITDYPLVLVDFSASKLVTEMALVQPELTIGSPEFAAPEQVKGKAVFASDLYSLGVICIHLLTGIPPFDLFDFASHEWVWRNYWISDSGNSSPDREHHRLAQLLDRLIEPDLNKRFPSAEMAIAEIQTVRGKKITVPTPKSSLRWECSATLIGHHGLFASVNVVMIAPDHSTLASASDDKTIRIWDIQTQKESFTLKGHAQFVKTIAFYPQNQTILASGSSDRTIKLWDLQERREIQTLAGHTHHVNALAFSLNGQILASGSSDKTIKLWNFETRELVKTLSGHTLAVNAIALSPCCDTEHQKTLASASSDSTVRIWNLNTFELIQTIVAHTAAVRAIAFSPDGRLLASGGEDRTIRLWDVSSWQCIQIFSGHPWSVSALTFSPDGDVLLSSSWDKTVKVWQVSTGNEIAVLAGHTDSVNNVTIASNGNIIATASKDKTIKLWTLQQSMNA
ncbi:MAG: protein kinase [Cyanobacteria bacterium CRU_2_1]|nr:protein kinase [Cyanobacteria bacterium RU_5_0]NJR57802.1 protein kinase [Cyanobacteria bacterium CRU_2_1]